MKNETSYLTEPQLEAGQLKIFLKQRLDNEQQHYWNVVTVVSLLFILFTILLLVTVHHFLRQREFKATQEKLQVMNQLEKANQELESFSYFTAHDLKEPVRTVSCFATLIDENHSNELSEKPKEYLSIVRHSALRMDQLIKDLLTYIGEGEVHTLQMNEIDLSELLQAVQQDLHLIISETNAKITHEPLPVIQTHNPSLHRIFQNIILNSIKYHREGIAPKVTVSAHQEDARWIIEIRDNGVGFDMNYAKTLCEPFKRLHDDEQVKGSGVGLAICKKLLKELDGEIWFNSKKGKGTSVFLSLPEPKNLPER